MHDMFTTGDFKKSKMSGKKISMLTAYDYPTAKIIDDAGIDSILVGDSLGTAVLGYEDTTKVTMEDMIHHTKAVSRGARRAFIVGDMPFLSYHMGKYESVKNAGRLVAEGGCKAVKMEGGEDIIEDVKAIIKAGIPVMGHLGYTPQSINIFGGHKAQGKTLQTAENILKDARLLEESGAFALVLECVPYKLAELVCKKIEIPVIGIGSGPYCDGQVLVSTDLLGYIRDFNPKHLKKYLNACDLIDGAVKNYIEDLNSGAFPTEKNSFTIDEDIIEALNK